MDNAPATPADKLRTLMIVAYGCFIAGILLPFVGLRIPFISIIGVIIAFIKRKDAAGTMYESHCIWIIRTFVIGLIAVLCAAVLMVIPGINIVAMFAMMLVGLWSLYRIVKGALRLWEKRPIENPGAWV